METENEKHWHGIGSIQGFFNGSYFCHTCLKAYKDKHKHTCSTSCDMCLHDACPKTKHEVGCITCGRVCRSLTCFERHKVCKKIPNNESIPPLVIYGTSVRNVALNWRLLNAILAYTSVASGSVLAVPNT